MAVIPGLERALARFPMAVAIAVLQTGYGLLAHESMVPEWIPSTFGPALWAALLWSILAALLAESRGTGRIAGAAIGFVGAVALVALYTFARPLGLEAGLLLAALLLTSGLALHHRPKDSLDGYWSFNHDLWLGAAMSIIAALLFSGGLSLIYASLDYLFGIKVGNGTYEKSWLVAGCLIAPLAWLAVVPPSRPYAAQGDDGVKPDRQELASHAIALLVKFILVPLLLIYAVILHVYAIKIVFDGTLPKGRLGWMVLIYGGTIAATALLAFPTRAGGGLVSLYWRLWPWLLPVPVVLLFLAVIQRVQQYGLTERRYLVLLAGIWFVSLIATQLASRRTRDLRVGVAMLAMLCLAASMGPWGMLQSSLREQAAKLTRMLQASNALADGRLKADLPPNRVFAKLEDANEAQRILFYLAQRDRLDLVRPLFVGLADDPFAKPAPPSAPARRHGQSRALPFIVDPGTNNFALANAIRARLVAPHDNTPGGFVSLYVTQPQTLLLDGPRQLSGAFNISLRGEQRLDTNILGRTYRFSIEGQSLVIVETVAPTRRAEFGITTHPDVVAAVRRSGDGVLSRAMERAITIARTAGDLPIELLLVNMEARSGLRADEVELGRIGFWIALAR